MAKGDIFHTLIRIQLQTGGTQDRYFIKWREKNRHVYDFSFFLAESEMTGRERIGGKESS